MVFFSENTIFLRMRYRILYINYIFGANFFFENAWHGHGAGTVGMVADLLWSPQVGRGCLRGPGC